MSEGEVVEDGVSRQGLRRVHVIRTGLPPDAGYWCERYEVPGEPVGVSSMFQYEDADVKGVFHLRLWWKITDVTECSEALR